MYWAHGIGDRVSRVVAGVPVFAGDKPATPPNEDGSKLMITSPKDGEEVDDSFELKYELTKGSQATHAHVYLDGGIGRVFPGRSRA